MTGSEATIPDLCAKLTALQGGTTKVALTSHIRPDGDAIGATLGLYHLLQRINVDATIIGLSPIPDRYLFLFDNLTIYDPETYSPHDYDLLIILDTGSIDRAPDFVPEWMPDIDTINIDHHPTNTGFASLNCVVPTASAVAEIITHMASLAKWNMSSEAATALWVGIVTDTGRFAYSCTTPTTLQAAATLLEAGVNTPEVDQYVFQAAPLGALRLHARAINNMQLLQDQRLAVISLSQQDFHDCGALSEDAEEIINLPRRINAVEVAVVITEMAQSTPERPCTKASLRTKPPFDAGQFCQSLGGGGHARAAGCELPHALAQTTDIIIQRIQKAWFSA